MAAGCGLQALPPEAVRAWLQGRSSGAGSDRWLECGCEPVAAALRRSLGRAREGSPRRHAAHARLLGRLSLDSARRQAATNWIKAYKRYVSGAANARLRDLPRHRLTPGAHVRVGTGAICKAGYVARVPSASHRQRAAAFRRYHLRRFARGYKVDHLVPVQIGGSNAVANLWPQHYAAPWGVRAKDRLDVMLRTLVCSGRLSLDSARRQAATNWIKAYKRYVSGAANARLRDLPRHRLTPGAHVRVGTGAICKAGYVARVPSASHRQRAAAFRRYHLRRFAHGYKVDHLVPVQIGGSNAVANLWPQHYDAPWGVRAKDRLDVMLRALVCSGRLSLASARRQEATNWIKAYKRYGGPSPSRATRRDAAPPHPGAAGRAPRRRAGLPTIRAAFYYPWFPQTWGSDPQNPFTNYLPTRGRYSTDVATVKAQIADMQYAAVQPRPRLVVRPEFEHRYPLAGALPGRTGHRVQLGAVLRARGPLRPDARRDRRRSALPAHDVRRRAGAGHAAGQGDARVRLQRGRSRHRPRLRDGDPLEAGEDILQRSTPRAVYVDLKVFPGYATCAEQREHRRLAPVRPGQRRSELLAHSGRRRVRDLPGVLEGRQRVRHRAVPGPRPRPLASTSRP